MIRLQEPELKPHEAHSAWQASWNDDEHMLAHTPPGYWQSLVEIAQIKRVLLDEMPADLRLRFLQTLNDRVHGILTVEAMQRVEPACDTAMKMLDEMELLSISDQCRLMHKWNVIAAFVNLNPSILEAIRLFGYRSAPAAASAIGDAAALAAVEPSGRA
jgi:hypothetical protein